MEEPAEKVLLRPEEIQSLVRKLAQHLSEDYEKELHLVVVLKGARRFSEDLTQHLKEIKPRLKIKKHFIRLSSYAGTETSGKIKLEKDIEKDLTGKDILIIEDIVDTGLTLDFLKAHLKKKGAGSVKVCTLLDKPSRRGKEVKLDYVGIEVPDRFIVGYGLDWKEKFRDLDYIAFLDQEKIDD